MEIRTGVQHKTRRFQIIPGGRESTTIAECLSEADTNIICHDAVVAQCTSIDGLELVEFEFLPDAA